MSWDLAFDPITKDLVRDGAGGWLQTDTGDTAVLNQLEVHFGRWWGDPGVGSLLFDRARFVSDPAVLVGAETRRALGLLVAEQYLADVDVQTRETQAGRVDGRTSYRVVETGQIAQLPLPRFGG
jgi:hypothetical protein